LNLHDSLLKVLLTWPCCKQVHILKMTVFWDVAPCSLVEFYRRFRGACCLQYRPDDGGSKHIWNVGKRLPDYAAQQPRRQPSSYLPPWEHKISLSEKILFMLFRFTCIPPSVYSVRRIEILDLMFFIKLVHSFLSSFRYLSFTSFLFHLFLSLLPSLHSSYSLCLIFLLS
jgi:hypothetical protein